MIEKTKLYINDLAEKRFAIMVPSPVIAEYLVGATATQFQEAEILRRGFETPAFDVEHARLAAILQRGGAVDVIHDEFGTSKHLIMIDIFIIATAIVEGAERIVTNNVDEFKKLAQNRVPIIPVPDPAPDSPEIPPPSRESLLLFPEPESEGHED